MEKNVKTMRCTEYDVHLKVHKQWYEIHTWKLSTWAERTFFGLKDRYVPITKPKVVCSGDNTFTVQTPIEFGSKDQVDLYLESMRKNIQPQSVVKEEV